MNYDYGLVSRFHNSITGQLAVVAAGLGENRTIAAGRFISDKKYLDELRKATQSPKAEQNF